MLTGTDTAHRAWDDLWKTEAGRAGWIEPDAHVVECARRLRERGFVRALDLGCGVGRHAMALAKLGFEVTAADASEAGLAELRRSAAGAGLAIETRHALMTDLPFPDAFFDYVLSFNVIYHGDGEIVRAALGEVARVLRPGGVFQGTMMSKRNAHYRVGREIAPDTFVQEGEDADRRHPHFFCDARELVGLFQDFDIESLVDRLHDGPGTWHWHVVAERRMQRGGPDAPQDEGTRFPRSR